MNLILVKLMHVCYMTYVPLWSQSTVCTLPSFHEWNLYYRKHMWGQRYYCHLASLFSEDCFFIQFLLIFKTNIFGRKFRDILGIYFKLNLFLKHRFLPLLFSNWKKCVLHCTKWIFLHINDVGRELSHYI